MDFSSNQSRAACDSQCVQPLPPARSAGRSKLSLHDGAFLPGWYRRLCFVLAIVGLWTTALVGDVRAQGTTTLISVSTGGAQTNELSYFPTISFDGRFIAFTSEANNLVPGDTNGAADIFLRDRASGTTSRVSVGSGGLQANSHSSGASLSADGRFVGFESWATNLVPGDTNGVTDVFVHDRLMGTTTRVSVGPGGAQGSGHSEGPVLSADGRFVAFQSASALVNDDTNAAWDVYVHDRVTGVTSRVSVGDGGVQGNGDSYQPVMSADGRLVAFASSATNLVPEDTNATGDIFVHDRAEGTTIRVNLGTGGVQANGVSQLPAISADGTHVAFQSIASNLVASDTNSANDVFAHDLRTGTLARVTRGIEFTESNGHSVEPAISADGRFLAFQSFATNIVLGDLNGVADVFIHDRLTNVTERISVGPTGLEASFWSYQAVLSGDGRAVVFGSWADNLVAGDTNGIGDIFVRDRHLYAPLPAGDYDGDRRVDVAVYRPATGVWYIVRSSTGMGVAIGWGTVGDIPAPADYDGDGRTDVAVYRPSTGVWWIIHSASWTAVAVRWGTLGDVPVPADYDGDGRADPTVFRPSNGVWYQLRSTSGLGHAVPWGTVGDLPVPADYDGDRRADPTVFRPSTGTWWQLRSTTGTGHGVRYGQNGDTPLAGDYDGDRKADPTIYRASTGTWYQLRSTTGAGYAVQWGTGGDIPIAGDYDGDGRADPTVFRPSTGTWYQLRSLTGTGIGLRWGTWGDLPQ